MTGCIVCDSWVLSAVKISVTWDFSLWVQVPLLFIKILWGGGAVFETQLAFEREHSVDSTTY